MQFCPIFTEWFRKWKWHFKKNKKNMVWSLPGAVRVTTACCSSAALRTGNRLYIYCRWLFYFFIFSAGDFCLKYPLWSSLFQLLGNSLNLLLHHGFLLLLETLLPWGAATSVFSWIKYLKFQLQNWNTTFSPELFIATLSRCTVSLDCSHCSSQSWCSSRTPLASTLSSTCSPARSSPPGGNQARTSRQSW